MMPFSTVFASLAVVARLNREIVEILRLPEVRDLLTARGFEIAATTPEAFEAELRSSAASWSKLVRQSGARIE
jgi:tripartite-type tricarboxylate transporter receptor subunit TctC